MNAGGGTFLNVGGFDFDRPFSSLSPAKQTSPKQARWTVNITRHINGSSWQAVLSTGTAVSLNRAQFHAEGMCLYMKRPELPTFRWLDCLALLYQFLSNEMWYAWMILNHDPFTPWQLTYVPPGLMFKHSTFNN
jgi:hypothetical protein